jgi:hypothetical protein
MPDRPINFSIVLFFIFSHFVSGTRAKEEIPRRKANAELKKLIFQVNMSFSSTLSFKIK